MLFVLPMAYNYGVKRKRKIIQLLIADCKKMSGDKKIRLGMQLSEMVRKVRRAGITATGN